MNGMVQRRLGAILLEQEKIKKKNKKGKKKKSNKLTKKNAIR